MALTESEIKVAKQIKAALEGWSEEDIARLVVGRRVPTRRKIRGADPDTYKDVRPWSRRDMFAVATETGQPIIIYPEPKQKK